MFPTVVSACITMTLKSFFPRIPIGTPVEIISGKDEAARQNNPGPKLKNPPAGSQDGARKHIVQPGG